MHIAGPPLCWWIQAAGKPLATAGADGGAHGLTVGGTVCVSRVGCLYVYEEVYIAHHISSTCESVCVYRGHVLGEELHSDPQSSVHEALGEPGLDIQVSDEAHQPDDQEGGRQHHLLSELLHTQDRKSVV